MPANPAFPEGDYSTQLNEFAREGQVIDGTPCIVNTYTANADIPYGVAVQWASEGKVTQGADATNFVGIAIADLANDNAENAVYKTGDNVNVLIAGTVVGKNTHATDTITAGSQLLVASGTDGTFVQTGGAGVDGAIWLDATVAGALGKVRLIGAQIKNA